MQCPGAHQMHLSALPYFQVDHLAWVWTGALGMECRRSWVVTISANLARLVGEDFWFLVSYVGINREQTYGSLQNDSRCTFVLQ